jgi:hypothetical protein
MRCKKEMIFPAVRTWVKRNLMGNSALADTGAYT